MTSRERLKNEMMVIKALGMVYGDIGTSPIYTLAVVLLLMEPTTESIFQILSMIFWTMLMLVTVQYAWLATSLSKRGEGGTVVLVQLLLPYLKGAKVAALVSVLGFFGISLMIGDGVITPAISILSSVEGIVLIPGLENTPKTLLLMIASGIALALFAVQKKGVEKVASAFGPIMVVWFFALALGGGYYLLQSPEVLKAISPLYAIHFIMTHPYIAFVVLADVLLCATGGVKRCTRIWGIWDAYPSSKGGFLPLSPYSFRIMVRGLFYFLIPKLPKHRSLNCITHWFQVCMFHCCY